MLTRNNASPVQPGQLLHQREANARAFVGSPFRTLHPVKALEQPRQLIRRNAGAGVADRKLEVAVFLSQGHLNGALERELEGVGEKIENNFFPHLAVDVSELCKRGSVHDQPQARLFDRRAEFARKVRSELRKIGRLI
jgi:hypothetical protein